MIYCKIDFKVLPPSPYKWILWHFDRADNDAIKRSMRNFPWRQQLSLNKDPNWQVKCFTNVLLNIMSNFVPNEVKHIIPRDPP